MGRSLKNREEAALENAREELAEEIDFYKFQQYEFDKQWSQLHAYANEQGDSDRWRYSDLCSI